MSAPIIASAEAWLARSFETGLEGEKARLEGVEAGLGDSEERGLSTLIGGFEICGNLIERLLDSRVVGVAHR